MSQSSTAEAIRSLPATRSNISEFPDADVRKVFASLSHWSWFHQPGKSIFADRLYLWAGRADVDADLADAAMRFLGIYGFVVSTSKLKWAVRKPFTSDLVDAACIAVAREKIGA